MKATQQLHDADQSLWLDNITRRLLTSGTLHRYIDELTITGLTSNPTIFDHAMKNSQDYDDASRTYKAYRTLLDTDRWLRLENAGARPQRVLWASTGTKNPEASDVLYIKALAAPHTVNTMPEQTLLAFAEHGEVGDMLAADGGNAEELLARFAKAGVDYDALAAKLQREGAEAFDASWNDLMGCIASKSELLTRVG